MQLWTWYLPNMRHDSRSARRLPGECLFVVVRRGTRQRRVCVLPLPGIFLEVVAGLLARLGDHAVATACLVVSGEVFSAAAIEAPMQAAGFGLRGIRRKDDTQPPLAGLMPFGNGRHVQDALAGRLGLFLHAVGFIRIVGKEGIEATGGTIDAGGSFGNAGGSHDSLL